MAKINLIVTVLTFIGFALNLTCYPIFNTEIIYWFGEIPQYPRHYLLNNLVY